MRLRIAAALISMSIACQPRSWQPPPPQPVPDAASPVVCCPPSVQPECCMAIGGAQVDGECAPLTCAIPDPTTPGWYQATDPDGCSTWHVPDGPMACGAPPAVDAGSPPCAPVAVTGYAPSALTPPRSPSTACAGQGLADFYDACITGGMSNAECSVVRASDAPCAQCLISSATDATWGAVVLVGAATKLNVAGCVALVQHDAGATSCAARVGAALGCESLACDAVCPLDVDGGAISYDACVQAAVAGECRAYLAAECDPVDAGIAQCLDPNDVSGFVMLASVFCGGT
jgi:hypothetical protein